MAPASKKRSRKSRKTAEGEEVPVSAKPSITVPARVPTIAIDEELRKEMGEIMTDIIFAAQEIVMAFAETTCNDKENCPLAEAAQELAKHVRKFVRLQREMSRT